MLTLEQINAASRAEFTALLAGTYEHSPWVAQAAWARRPFATLAALKHALAASVREAGREAQLSLVRAHPDLAGKAMLSTALTAESRHEQATAGLSNCTPQERPQADVIRRPPPEEVSQLGSGPSLTQELAQIQQLNAEYNASFGWPFILAVRGPRGLGLTRQEIIATLQRRLAGDAQFEFAECLRHIHRIAELRLNDKFGFTPTRGQRVWDEAEELAAHSDPGFKEHGQLTVAYLTDAHLACARQLQGWMREAGFDEVHIDAVGNVVGVYHGADPASKRLLTGSHYDTVRNGGKYDGRLGILVPLAAVRELHAAGRRLPFGIELLGFAEEEGQRYKATFLGSGALTGGFNPAWLEQQDEGGVSMRQAMQAAGLPATLAAINACRRDPARYLGFVEVHIEQGPVLNERDLPLGVVSAINGSLRYVGEVIGQASHAGTTPMGRRRDAACAVAELALFVERRAAAVADGVGKNQEGAVTDGSVGLNQEGAAASVGMNQEDAAASVGTVGLLQVPAGSINVVPGRCQFSLDLRASSNAARDALGADVLAALARICSARGVAFKLEQTLAASAAPSAPAWQRRWEAAVRSLGLPVLRMPSGAGHDAMKLHEAMPQAMLFVRGGNSGISHNPLETITADDAELCVAAFSQLLEQLVEPLARE